MNVDEFMPKYAHIVARIPKGWGHWIEVGDGWSDIIIKLDADLAKIDPDYKLNQCKEKFGGLRYYAEHDIEACGATDLEGVHVWRECPFEQVIREAEALSYQTCEVCGEPGLPRLGQWVKTLCDEHAEGAEPHPDFIVKGKFE